jgi:2-polyprenyl-6-methoxyphenol hydroxylase-like FAD-dependent oxidoreductase
MVTDHRLGAARAEDGELTGQGDRVTGVRLRDKRMGGSTSESAALVVGADGKHSTVARLVGAAERRRVAAATFAFYAYWDGLPVKVARSTRKQDSRRARGRPTMGSL